MNADLILDAAQRPREHFYHPFTNKGQGHDEWLTPPEIITSLGAFDLDPCAPVERPWPTALKHFTRNDNGLTKEWAGRVWLNPPYGAETGKWLGRLAEHGDGVALIFARTETEMFFRHVWNAAAGILFLEGRISFYRTDGTRAQANAGAPSCLVAYNQENLGRLFMCGIKGKVVAL